MQGRFVANEGNLGGKNAIRRQLLEHHNAIVHAKPTIDSRKKPPSHVDAKVDPKKKLSKAGGPGKFDEVYQSFRKVAEMKSGYIDASKPGTFDIKKKALPKNKKANDFINQEHMFHLKSQQRKIGNVGRSMAERKKNLFDPVAHPALFFRRPDESNKDISLDYMFSSKTGGARNVSTGFNVTKMKNQVSKRPLSAFNKEEIEFGDMALPPEKSFSNLGGTKKEKEVPEFTGNFKDAEAYHEYKLKVLDHIIDNRLYKALDLDILKEKIKLKYPAMEKTMVNDMFEQINIDLDK